jgi:hypothetical protein
MTSHQWMLDGTPVIQDVITARTGVGLRGGLAHRARHGLPAGRARLLRARHHRPVRAQVPVAVHPPAAGPDLRAAAHGAGQRGVPVRGHPPAHRGHPPGWRRYGARGRQHAERLPPHARDRQRHRAARQPAQLGHHRSCALRGGHPHGQAHSPLRRLPLAAHGRRVGLPGKRRRSDAQAAYFNDHDGILWRLDLSSKDPDDWDYQAIWDMFHDLAADQGQPAYNSPILSTLEDGRVVIIQRAATWTCWKTARP